MRTIGSLLVFAVVQVASFEMAWAADAPVFGTFTLFKVNQDWGNLSLEERQQGGEEAKSLLESFKNTVIVDAYWT